MCHDIAIDLVEPKPIETPVLHCERRVAVANAGSACECLEFLGTPKCYSRAKSAGEGNEAANFEMPPVPGANDLSYCIAVVGLEFEASPAWRYRADSAGPDDRKRRDRLTP